MYLTLLALIAYNSRIRTAESSGRVPTRMFRLRGLSILVVRNSTGPVIACSWNT